MKQLTHRTTKNADIKNQPPYGGMSCRIPQSTVLFLALVLAGAWLSTGCGSTKVTTQNKESVGQQLMDLDKAYKDGVISEKEYQKLKRRIVKDND